MKVKLLVMVMLICLVAGGWILFVTYDNRFPFGRIWETPGIRGHEESIAYMVPGRVPWDGGEAEYRFVVGGTLRSPVDPGNRDAVKEGGRLYGLYCQQCHGEYFDGRGTVGQSFAPLPGDLMSEKVQSLPDGTMFQEISYGVPGGRQPALATTIAVQDRWLIIAYVKSLGVR